MLSIFLSVSSATCGGPWNPDGVFQPPIPYRAPQSASEFSLKTASELSPNIWITEGPLWQTVHFADLLAQDNKVFIVYFLSQFFPDTQKYTHGVYLTRSLNGGENFLPPQLLTPAEQYGVPSVHLSLDTCGKLVVWVEENTTGSLIVAESDDSGETFSEWLKIPNFHRSNYYLWDTVKRPPCGKLVADVIQRATPSQPQKPLLLKVTLEPFNSALTPIPVFPNGEMWGTAISGDAIGLIFHAQTLLIGTNSHIHLYRTEDSGETFQGLPATIGPLLGFTPHLFYPPFLLYRTRDEFFILWRDLKDRDLSKPRWMVARSEDGGNSFSNFLNATADSDPGSGDASVALDGNGRLWVAYAWCDPFANPEEWGGWTCELRLTYSHPNFTAFSPSRRVSEILTYSADPRYQVCQSIRKPILALDETTRVLHGIWLDTRFTISPSEAKANSTSLFYFRYNSNQTW